MYVNIADRIWTLCSYLPFIAQKSKRHIACATRYNSGCVWPGTLLSKRWVEGCWQHPVKLSRAEIKTERLKNGRYIFSTGKSPASVSSRLTRAINSCFRQFQRNNFNSCCKFPHYWELIKGKCTDSRVWFLGRIPQTPPQIIRRHFLKCVALTFHPSCQHLRLTHSTRWTMKSSKVN